MAVNQTELGRDVELPQPTVRRYLNLLETSYLLVRLPSYAVHRTKRLIKSPKLYWADTGVALHLAGSDAANGHHLENLVLQDLLSWHDARLEQAEIHYRRTHHGGKRHRRGPASSWTATSARGSTPTLPLSRRDIYGYSGAVLPTSPIPSPTNN
jgi:hypothetical protein